MSGSVATARICRDVDCPACGFPETYVEVDVTQAPPGAGALGCRRCGWRVGQDADPDEVAETERDLAERRGVDQ